MKIFLLKVKIKDIAKLTFTCSKSTIKTPEQSLKFVLVSLLLTLNWFHTFFWYFHCQLWISKCRVGGLINLSRTDRKSLKSVCFLKDHRHWSCRILYCLLHVTLVFYVFEIFSALTAALLLRKVYIFLFSKTDFQLYFVLINFFSRS